MARHGLFIENDAEIGAGIDFTDPDSPWVRWYLTAGQVAAAGLIAAVFVLLNFAKLWHTDIWGHVKFGERILDTRQLPNGEPFCPFAEPSVRTVNYAWLSQALFAAAYRIGAECVGGDEIQRLCGGADGIRFLVATLTALRFGLLFVAFRRLAGSATLATAGLGFIIATGPGNLAVARPQVVAEVLFAMQLMLLAAYELTWKHVISAALVMTIWANAHGSYPVGLMMLGALWAGRLLGILFGPPPRLLLASVDNRFIRLSWAIFLSLIGITLLNPEGWRIWLATFEMARHPNVRAMDEWQPLTSAVASGARVTYGCCLALIAVAASLNRARIGWTGIVLLVGFAIPPLVHQRAAVWLIVAAPVIALPALGRFLSDHRPWWWHSDPSLRKTFVAGMLVMLALYLSIPVQRAQRAEVDPSRVLSDGTRWQLALAVENPGLVPDTRIAQLLRTTYPRGEFVGTVFASETQGDFFLWRLPPPARVFIYTHVHLFSPEHWRRWTYVRDMGRGWQSVVDRYYANLIVLEHSLNPRLCNELRNDPAWIVLVDDQESTTATGNQILDPRCRIFAALRKMPLVPRPVAGVR